MGKGIFALVFILAILAATVPSIALAVHSPAAKVDVCHVPDDGGDPHTISISQKAADKHIANDAEIALGACV